jgi:hypothetical protein
VTALIRHDADPASAATRAGEAATLGDRQEKISIGDASRSKRDDARM